jgi:hypothetical protein
VIPVDPRIVNCAGAIPSIEKCVHEHLGGGIFWRHRGPTMRGLGWLIFGKNDGDVGSSDELFVWRALACDFTRAS